MLYERTVKTGQRQIPRGFLSVNGLGMETHSGVAQRSCLPITKVGGTDRVLWPSRFRNPTWRIPYFDVAILYAYATVTVTGDPVNQDRHRRSICLLQE